MSSELYEPIVGSVLFYCKLKVGFLTVFKKKKGREINRYCVLAIRQTKIVLSVLIKVPWDKNLIEL